MIKILRYEVQRMLCSKIYVMFCITIVGFSWYILTGTVIRGIAYTAPFSPWSFGYYLSQTVPLLLIMELFYISILFSDHEEQVKNILLATPVKISQYMLIRLISILIGCIVLSVCIILAFVGFSNLVFSKNVWMSTIHPMCFTLIPSFVFITGIAISIVKKKKIFLYLLMIAVILVNQFTLPYGFSLTEGNFFREYPKEITNLDPKFFIPITHVPGRLILILIGILLIINNLEVKNKKMKDDFID